MTPPNDPAAGLVEALEEARLIVANLPHDESLLLAKIDAALAAYRTRAARTGEGEEAAKVFLGPFLEVQGLYGALLNQQAGKVYDAAVAALLAALPSNRASE